MRLEISKDNIEVIKNHFYINDDNNEFINQIFNTKSDFEELSSRCNKMIRDYEGAIIHSTFGLNCDKKHGDISVCKDRN